MNENFAGALHRNLTGGRGEKIAVRCGGDSITYSQLGALANRAGNALAGLGVRRGDRVALLMFDGPEFIAAFYGAASIGAVPVPLNTVLAAAEYEFMLNHSEAKVAVVSAALGCQIEPIRAKCPNLEHIVRVGGPAGADTLDWKTWTDAASADGKPVEVAGDEPAFWLYSSGSSGRPKGVVHLHRSIACTARLYAEGVLGLRTDDICFSAAKLFHAYGLGNGMNFPIHVGATTVLNPGPPSPETLFEIIARTRPTVFFATPALFVGMLEQAGPGKPCDEGSIRFCVSAGEALPAATFTRWKGRFGIEILDGIGSTEMLHIFISNRPSRARAGSSGELVEGYRAKIVDEAGAATPVGEIGDLWVGGESAAACYWGEPEKTRATMRDGWMVTGDKYRRDEDGFFWHQGRADDMLKVNSLWVSPVEIEGLLHQHPDVKECAVVGLRDEHDLMQVKAFVVLKAGVEGSPALVRKLQAFVRQRAPQRYPRQFEFVERLPKTATGKIKRFELREQGVPA